MKSKLFGMLFVALLAIPVAAGAVPIINGGFETGNLTGWTCTGADRCEADTDAPHSGVWSLVGFDNSGFATLSQTTGTTIGETYTFEFWSFRNVSSPANILRYQIGAGPVVLVTPSALYALTTTTFLATAASTAISFYFETDPGTGLWFIDDVSVSPIPEPAALTLLGLGLAGVVTRRLRKA